MINNNVGFKDSRIQGFKIINTLLYNNNSRKSEKMLNFERCFIESCNCHSLCESRHFCNNQCSTSLLQGWNALILQWQWPALALGFG